jgi:hypothetical protein
MRWLGWLLLASVLAGCSRGGSGQVITGQHAGDPVLGKWVYVGRNGHKREIAFRADGTASFAGFPTCTWSRSGSVYSVTYGDGKHPYRVTFWGDKLTACDANGAFGRAGAASMVVYSRAPN